MPGPATKLGSLTGHGGTVMGPGCPTVLIEGVPAIRVGTDMHICPMVTPGAPPIPHGGMNNVGPGVPNVLIGGQPASTVGDLFLCVGPPAPVVMGAMSVIIGTGAAGGSGSGAAASSAEIAKALKAGTVDPIKGTETFPIEIQAALLACQPSMSKKVMEEHIKTIADAYADVDDLAEDDNELTIADIVEILKGIEKDEGFEAARFFSSHLDFEALTEMTMAFTSGEDKNSENDPNIMPTRFMILYGADDSKLQHIDNHPDGTNCKINVENLRKSLNRLGYNLGETGPYDDEVYRAHIQYMEFILSEFDPEALVELPEHEEPILETSGTKTLSIKLKIKVDDPDRQDDSFILYSTDRLGSYRQIKTVKDDANQSKDTLELIFTDIREDLRYTFEIDPGSTGKKEYYFRNRPYGKWFDE